jgi:hypothetical protein
MPETNRTGVLVLPPTAPLVSIPVPPRSGTTEPPPTPSAKGMPAGLSKTNGDNEGAPSASEIGVSTGHRWGQWARRGGRQTQGGSPVFPINELHLDETELAVRLGSAHATDLGEMDPLGVRDLADGLVPHSEPGGAGPGMARSDRARRAGHSAPVSLAPPASSIGPPPSLRGAPPSRRVRTPASPR